MLQASDNTRSRFTTVPPEMPAGRSMGAASCCKPPNKAGFAARAHPNLCPNRLRCLVFSSAAARSSLSASLWLMALLSHITCTELEIAS